MERIDTESEIRSWLNVALKEENLDDFSLKILGNSEKGDGYLGDIVFISLTPINGTKKRNYNLVLKCSKRSQALREKSPVQQAFLNEIYLYDMVFPAFAQFQLEKGVTETFSSVPKYYGAFRSENMEIIIFEDMKNLGYSLWNKKNPLTRKHIELVISEYAKFHAVSIAMKDQNPEKFAKLTSGLIDTFQRFLEEIEDITAFYAKGIDEIHDLLKDDLDESILLEWKELKTKTEFIFGDMIKCMDGVDVILHGDCWSNNFLFKHAMDNEILPLNVAILDWQISRCSSPIMDLSYFLFASISKEDIEDLDKILRFYYELLSNNVKNLGSDLDAIYPFEQFMTDWRKYCKYGILLGSFIHKICASDKDEVIDIGEFADKGEHFSKSFEYDVKDTTCFKNRSRHIIKYVVENNLI